MSTFLIILGCKEKSKNEEQQSIHINSYEEDEQLLEEKLSFTNKIWDSLDTILRRRPADTIYRNSIRKSFQENKERQITVYQDFIFENPNSLLSIETLDNMKFAFGKEITSELFAIQSENNKAMEIGKRIENFIELYQNPKITDSYTDFELPNLNGEIIRLSENLGKYTLIDFWASWCGPCRKSNPELIEIYNKYSDKNFKIIGVSVDDDKNSWVKAVKKDNLNWINVSDLRGRENTAALKYGIKGVPTNFLIDDMGIIVAINISSERLDKKLNQNL